MPFLGEKKAQQSRKDCAWHISSFIVAKFFSRDELKPEKPNGDQTALKV
ncbi:hypothetical protein RMB03_10920 [Acinetobacter sp. V91_7]|nr:MULTISPECIES: hypothetical protein [unclassified Acinetobacter]MDS7933244.1 hypothetical protein [Acinetobacter sp. V91_4B]MDS7963469.1 hypothetical protein [Acinetobacter sp. V91_7]MDS8027498.1 hypothetical protein [Acinetobacter sp. V91_13]